MLSLSRNYHLHLGFIVRYHFFVLLPSLIKLPNKFSEKIFLECTFCSSCPCSFPLVILFMRMKILLCNISDFFFFFSFFQTFSILLKFEITPHFIASFRVKFVSSHVSSEPLDFFEYFFDQNEALLTILINFSFKAIWYSIRIEINIWFMFHFT